MSQLAGIAIIVVGIYYSIQFIKYIWGCLGRIVQISLKYIMNNKDRIKVSLPRRKRSVAGRSRLRKAIIKGTVIVSVFGLSLLGVIIFIIAHFNFAIGMY